MPLPPGGLTLPNVYALIGHFIGQNGVDTWRSQFHVFKSASPIAPGDGIVGAIAEYFKANLITTATLDHIEARNATWGDIPYSSQAALWSQHYGAAGTKTTHYSAEGTAGVGKEVCCYVTVSNSGPKPGKQFIRGFLDNADVYASVGGPWLFITGGSPSNVNDTKFQTMIAAVGLGSYFGGSADPRVCTTHFSLKEYNINPANLPFESSITAMHIVRPTINKPTRSNKK